MRHMIIGSLTVALVVAGFCACLTTAVAEDAKADAHEHMHHEMDKCITACGMCAKECESCFAHCARLVSEGKKEHLKTLRTCIDCGDLCALAAKVQSRHGVFSKYVCEACLKACEDCAAACGGVGGDDEHMKKCSAACKECAAACRDMIKAAAK